MTDTTLPEGLSPRARVFAFALLVVIFVLGALASRRPLDAKPRPPVVIETAPPVVPNP
jgi:hypothetical protein